MTNNSEIDKNGLIRTVADPLAKEKHEKPCKYIDISSYVQKKLTNPRFTYIGLSCKHRRSRIKKRTNALMAAQHCNARHLPRIIYAISPRYSAWCAAKPHTLRKLWRHHSMQWSSKTVRIVPINPPTPSDMRLSA